MLAADSKVVAAPASELINQDSVYSWRQMIEPVEPFLEAVHARLSTQVNEFDRRWHLTPNTP